MSTMDEIRLSTTSQQTKRLSSIRHSRSSTDPVPQAVTKEQERQEYLINLLNEIYAREKQHQDDEDVSLQPSFSKFQVPYFIKCRNRYNASKKLHEQRFQYEIEQLIAQQATGYEAARLYRHLSITTIWPPLHSRSEIAHTQRYFFSLSRKERKRLNWIMNTNII